MPSPRVWFITGSSTGFGKSMVELVLKSGDIAVATLRKPEALADLAAKWPSDRLLVVKLDVTKSEEIVAAFAKAKEAFGRIDVVFNNAGYCVLSEIEGTPDQVARDMFEVNFWGAANVSREAIKFFREVNKPAGGHLLQNSSALALSAGPITGYYGATKYALEGLSESLAQEIDPKWNIKITLIEPGPFRTDAVKPRSIVNVPIHSAYTDPALPSSAMRQIIVDPENNPLFDNPDKGNQAIYELIDLKVPPLRFPLGKVAIEYAKNKIANINGAVDEYASWSDNLGFGSPDLARKELEVA